jgi:hypothetical protein
MESEVPEVKEVANIRFGSIIFLFRLAGIPFKMKKISTIYAIYMITVTLCTCTTFIGMFVDMYVHRDDLRHAITNIPASIGVTNIVWIFFYCRYVRTLADHRRLYIWVICLISTAPHFWAITKKWTQIYYRSYNLKRTLFIPARMTYFRLSASYAKELKGFTEIWKNMCT